jgi:DNA modification methylase
MEAGFIPPSVPREGSWREKLENMGNSEISEWTGSYCGKKWTLYCGNSATVLRELKDESVNCIVTSPPYYSLRDYQIDGQIGLEETVREYVDALCTVFEGLYRILKKDGLFFLNIGDTYYSGKGESQGIDPKSNKRRFGLRPVDKSGGLGMDIQRKSAIGIPWRVALKMMSQKWILRAPIIWHRDKALPESVRDRPRRSYEYIFMFAKDRKYFFNRSEIKKQRFDEDVWTIMARPKPNGGIQTAPYPDELVKRCLDIGCTPDGTVLDPFVGSGTTMRVALQSGRSATGIDLNPIFCNHILSALREGKG